MKTNRNTHRSSCGEERDTEKKKHKPITPVVYSVGRAVFGADSQQDEGKETETGREKHEEERKGTERAEMEGGIL